MLAVIVGLIEIGLGLGKLGFVAGLLSKEVQVGYMNGLGITIIVGQLPKLFGFSTDADGFVDEVRQFLTNLDADRHHHARRSALSVLPLLLVLPRFTTKIPAVLVAVVGATVVSAWFDLAAEGVAVTGALPQGVPTPSIPWTSVADVGPLLLAAVGITLVSLTDTIATATSFAARRGDEVDADQEMVGMGAVEHRSPGCSRASPSPPAGRGPPWPSSPAPRASSPVVVGAGVVLLLLLVFPSLLADLPQTALAAVVIAAALSLMDLSVLRRYVACAAAPLVLSVIATVGVVLFGVLQGILVAVILSILLFFRRSWWPHGEVLGRVDELDGWHSTERYPDSDRGRRSRRLPLGGPAVLRQLERSSWSRSASWSASSSRAGSCCSARRSPMSTSPPPTCSAGSTTSSTPRASTWPSSSSAADSAIWSSRYGLDDTLDRDHFYPSSKRHSPTSPAWTRTSPETWWTADFRRPGGAGAERRLPVMAGRSRRRRTRSIPPDKTVTSVNPWSSATSCSCRTGRKASRIERSETAHDRSAQFLAAPQRFPWKHLGVRSLRYV